MRISFSELKGKTFTKVELVKEKAYHSKDRDHIQDSLIFHCTDGYQYVLTHEQNCCEDVLIEDISGNLKHLENSEILIAQERTADDRIPENQYSTYGPEKQWTFYVLGTEKGYVTIRWYGSSNGYYSIGVDLFKEAYEAKDPLDSSQMQ